METFSLFTELKIPEGLAEALTKMEFIEPTPIQAQSIPPALLGHDILGIAATGTGKTAAFGIPLLTKLYYNNQASGLILAPTRELAAQIHKVLRQMSTVTKMRGALLVGGESFRRQLEELRKGCDYIVATPGRLIDHLEEKTISLSSVGVLVLDEVDRMLDMGFLPQVRQIVRYIPEKRQTLIFSATLPDEITRLTSQYLHEPIRVEVGTTTSPSEQIATETIEVTHLNKPDVLVDELNKRTGRALIFASRKDRAEVISRHLERHGIPNVFLHGGRHQKDRKKALEGFRDANPRVMVATDLAGRGIDVADIELVINYDLPNTREDYIHRVGRTGRAGKTGIALNFVTPQDFEAQRILEGKKSAAQRRTFRSGRRR